MTSSQAREQRLIILGTLAISIAHDLNNVLTTIITGLELIRDGADNTVINLVDKSAHRGSDIVRQLLIFARGSNGEGNQSELRPDDILHELGQMIRTTFPKAIKLELKTNPDLPNVRGDATLIQQVLLNLCINARDAMPKGGILALSASQEEEQFITFQVCDEGSGIPEDVLPHIWEPFYTTKAKGEGTGMGLAIVKNILTDQGGKITVTSGPSGSVFSVSLPIAPKTAPATAPEKFDGAGKLIMVVDDEEPIRTVVKLVLESANYKVAAMSSGLEALEYFEKQKRKIAAVLTDLRMPNMTGSELAEKLLEHRADLPILFMTGTDTRISSLKKPFSQTELLEALHKAT